MGAWDVFVCPRGPFQASPPTGRRHRCLKSAHSITKTRKGVGAPRTCAARSHPSIASKRAPLPLRPREPQTTRSSNQGSEIVRTCVWLAAKRASIDFSIGRTAATSCVVSNAVSGELRRWASTRRAIIPATIFPGSGPTATRIISARKTSFAVSLQEPWGSSESSALPGDCLTSDAPTVFFCRKQSASSMCQGSSLNVFTGQADETLLGRLGTTDVIVLLDVIEHLPSPRDTIALLVNHLDPGGIIVITTGDFGSLYSRVAGAHWRLMTPPQHLWFFSQASMQAMATSLGLEVEHLDHPWKVVPLSLISFQLTRMSGLRPKRMVISNRLGLPVNLFDAMRVVLRKPSR